VDGIRWLALREAGMDLEVEIKRIGPYRPDVAGGTQAAVDLGPHPPGAVIAYNDLIAIGMIRKFMASGVRVPEDVSVIGFDNIFASELITPALTTVDAPRRTQGITAVQHLIAVIGGARPRAGEPFVLPARLVVRASTGPVARSTGTINTGGVPKTQRKRPQARPAGAPVG
jgi:DNA-binding LacI/PurR family transcriptional regulator